MSTAAITTVPLQSRLLVPILVGGGVAGALDMTSAFISFGHNMPLGIAAGLIGRQAALQGGAFIWILGLVLHYFIALSAATVYCLASHKLTFLKDHWLVSGVFYGIGFYLVMNLIVLPLSAYHFMGPYQYRSLVQGLLTHMTIIALPISYSVHKLS